uniref:Uncharacterized protein n=1 Tax=Romanomermis culicivorax TaxID=13658 RepID=A0A915IMS2_ROMCU
MIIAHTPHDQVHTAALQHIDPSLDEVLKIAQAFEATLKTVQTIKGKSSGYTHEVQQMTGHYKAMKKVASQHQQGSKKQLK